MNIDLSFKPPSPRMIPERLDPFVGGRNPHPQLLKADLNQPLPLRHSCVEEVVICHTLEHLLSPYHLLREVYRVLKPGGRLKVIVPNAQRNDADWFNEGHIYSFTLPTVKRLVERAGFKVIEAKTIIEDLDIYVEAVR